MNERLVNDNDNCEKQYGKNGNIAFEQVQVILDEKHINDKQHKGLNTEKADENNRTQPFHFSYLLVESSSIDTLFCLSLSIAFPVSPV